LKFLRTAGPNSSALDEVGFTHLDSLLASLRPDLVVIDPLIALCGGGNINDNAVMSLVMRELKKVAIKYDCAILIVLHTRKGGDLTTADAISGASAIKDLARRAIMPVTMTADDMKQFDVLPSERRQYFKLVDAKSNLAALSVETWYKLENQELPNAEPPTYPHGDRVQAVVRAKLSPSKSSSAAGPEQQRIRFELLKLIERGITIDGETFPYSPNGTGKNKMRAILDDAMDAVKRVSEGQEYAPSDLRAVAERELEALKQEGWAVVETIEKGRFRRTQCLRPVWERTPWARERESLREHGGPTVRTEEEEAEWARRDLFLQDAPPANGQWVNGEVNS
jgi:AAA domain